MKRLLAVGAIAATGLLAACGGTQDMSYRPAPQLLPSNIQKIAVRMVQNKTQQFGLEDKFTLRIRDEFLRDSRYPIAPESEAHGVVIPVITRYILTPIQFDSHLVPTAYRLRVMVDVQFVDRSKNTAIWEERNLEGLLQYPAATLPGGLTEELARQQIWDTLARDIVKRTIQGFGSVTGRTGRRQYHDGPSTEPAVDTGDQKVDPVLKTPY